MQPPRRKSVAVLLALSLGCSSTRLTSAPAAAAPTPVIGPDPHGDVAFRVIPPPIVTQPEPADATVSTRLTHPRAVRELTKPLYPKEALVAGAGDYTVVVRITIGKDGKVSRIDDSDRVPSTAGPFAATFRAAVEQAVRQWEFTPGVLGEETPGKDLDGDGTIDYVISTRFETVPVFYHLRFDFTVVDGKGEVRGGM